MADREELKTFTNKRGQIKGKLTRFQTFFDNHANQHSIAELQVRLSRLEECWGEFETVQDKIEVLDTETDHSIERESFETQYFGLFAKVKQYIENSCPKSTESTNGASEIRQPITVGSSIPVRLPTITLPTFTGNYDEWMPYFDAFQSLIHHNDQLSDLQKLQYLKGSLKGAAAETLQNLELTSANYAVALELLKQQYQNIRQITQQHVKSLCDLPPTQKDNPSSLRKIVNATLTHLRALNALNVDTSNWDLILIHQITTRLDTITHREWELTTVPNELPTLQQLTDFLQKRCLVLENIHKSQNSRSQQTHSIKPAYPPNKYNNNQNYKTNTHFTKQEPHCAFCNQQHTITHCQELRNTSHNDRITKLTKSNICINCLTLGHNVQQCRSKGCRTCGRKHHTLLHIYKPFNNTTTTHIQAETTQGTPARQTSQTVSSSSVQNSSEVILSTAVVDLISPEGQKMTCRAFLDSGSQSSFITEAVCQTLQLKRQHTSLSVTGINQKAVYVKNKVQATIQSRHTGYNVNVEFLVLPKITGNLPTCKIRTGAWDLPNDIHLADPTFGEPRKIDLLLGQEYFLDMLDVGQIKSDNRPTLQNTKLGWIVGGRVSHYYNNSTTTTCHLSVMDRVDLQLQRFWEVEEPASIKHSTTEEKQCETHYAQTVKRGEDGRYTVTMPFKQPTESLGQSYDTAARRYKQVEKRFNRNPALHCQYSNFMAEYKELQHMELLSTDRGYPNKDPEFFLPHHPVIKESSSTTKLRVVFDASAKTSTGVSLNDILLVGPTIQDDLFSIVSRFRMHPIVITADIEKMYRQIWINPSQRSLLKLLWREHPEAKLDTYQLNTITYGTACAPFLATRTLHQLASDEKTNFPIASKIILQDFYVDDLLTGTDCIRKATHLQNQLVSLLKSGGFNLRKWNSNHPELLKHLPSNMIENHPQELPPDSSSSTKALGLTWDAKEDVLKYKFEQSTRKSVHLTKRAVLSDIAKLFDPLGLVAPVIVKAKLFMQELWQRNLSWDEHLPEDAALKWHDFVQCLFSLNKISINRCVTLQQQNGSIEIHGFSDASEKAYGAAIYIRQNLSNDTGKVSLLCSKSKVSPLKTVSLPRLELCAALLLTELMAHVVKALHNWNTTSHFWTDSTIVLAWISTDAANWKTFVANRVAKIQTLSNPKNWKHVRGEENPADIVSRGLQTNELLRSKLWWSGPTWLSNPSSTWPTWPQKSVTGINLPERKGKELSAPAIVTTNTVNDLISKFSSLEKLQRVTSYIRRFINNCRNPNSKITGSISTEELKTSMHKLIKNQQQFYFSPEYTSLKINDCVSNKSKLISFKPILDQDDIIRVGGRLENSTLSHDQKHPIILPEKSHLAKLIAISEHRRHLHAGPQLLLSAIRQRFWPLNGRNLVRNTVHQCVTCFKAKPKWSQPQMGNLPSTRITPARPFTNTGVDYCGPIYVKSGKVKNSKMTKGYIAVFVCLATKAIHLELVSDLTTEAFLAALKRFTSRRGISLNIYSDNGTNFVGARNELNDLYHLLQKQQHQDQIKNYTSSVKTSWHFIPPNAPHFGGVWEAGVKSVKHHLRRVVGNAKLTFEECYTTLTLIEACLNSRPLTPLSTSPNDSLPLTPGHFLTGAPLTALPEPDITAINTNRLSRWQRCQQLTQHFWSRWSKEYLSQLQQRHKWTTETPDIKPGQVVLVKEDNLPPLKWITAIVEEVHIGPDGRVRVATVRTSQGNHVKRAANRLCVLPIDNN